jgi:hypothetical protein
MKIYYSSTLHATIGNAHFEGKRNSGSRLYRGALIIVIVSYEIAGVFSLKLVL